MPRQEKAAALDNQARRGGEERLRRTRHQQSTGDNCHTSRDARRVAGFGRVGRVSATPKGAYWDDEDGWSSSGPEISARDYEKELEMPGQGLDEQSDVSNRTYEPSECSDREPVMSEPANGNGWSSDAEELDVHMACIQAVHHYPIDDEPSEGEEPWPNMVGQDEEGQRWTYAIDDIPCEDYPDCEVTVEHWRECDSPDFYTFENEGSEEDEEASEYKEEEEASEYEDESD
jgi:hypothetical protein